MFCSHYCALYATLNLGELALLLGVFLIHEMPDWVFKMVSVVWTLIIMREWGGMSFLSLRIVGIIPLQLRQ